MFNPQDDPLGLGLMQRARAQRQAQQTNNPAAQAYMSGPLPDQNWDAFFQASNEATGGKGLNFRGGPAPEGSNQIAGTASNPMMGLMNAGQPGLSAPSPQAVQGLQGAGPHNEQELRARRARMLNQDQPQANRTPYAGS